MAVNNSLVKSSGEKPKFSVAIQGDGYKKLINNTLGDPKRSARFVTAITSAVSVNPALQNCDAGTILSAGLLGEGLNLSPSPQLGQYYIVPFNDNKNKRTVATFQLGYKGYIQLAIRSGQYKDIDVLEIKEGEFLGRDSETGKYKFEFISNESDRESRETVGYYAMFEYMNGFRKTLYWSKEKMENHARQYSQGYAKDLSKGEKNTFWSKDFDAMACKTMLRQLISKWGIMSIDMQTAVESDMGVIRDNGNVEYVDEYEPEQPIIVNNETGEVVENEQQIDADDLLFGGNDYAD